MVYRFYRHLINLLRAPEHASQRLVYVSDTQAESRANCATLMAIFAVVALGCTDEEAVAPLLKLQPPLVAFRDASHTTSTYDLTVSNVVSGVYQALLNGFFDFTSFDLEEYEFYERVENGDFNWIVPHRFLALAGPHNERHVENGYPHLSPEDYFEYFRATGITDVVRLNKRLYNRMKFVLAGFRHHDLFFTDGSTPPRRLLDEFLNVCERAEGAIAVHCKAGLGRTGTLIGAYMMKHYRMKAEEAIAWLRLARPGSVIGPQQHYLHEMEEHMWQAGAALGVRRKTEADRPAWTATSAANLAWRQPLQLKNMVIVNSSDQGLSALDAAAGTLASPSSAGSTPPSPFSAGSLSSVSSDDSLSPDNRSLQLARSQGMTAAAVAAAAGKVGAGPGAGAGAEAGAGAGTTTPRRAATTAARTLDVRMLNMDNVEAEDKALSTSRPMTLVPALQTPHFARHHSESMELDGDVTAVMGASGLLESEKTPSALNTSLFSNSEGSSEALIEGVEGKATAGRTAGNKSRARGSVGRALILQPFGEEEAFEEMDSSGDHANVSVDFALGRVDDGTASSVEPAMEADEGDESHLSQGDILTRAKAQAQHRVTTIGAMPGYDTAGRSPVGAARDAACADDKSAISSGKASPVGASARRLRTSLPVRSPAARSSKQVIVDSGIPSGSTITTKVGAASSTAQAAAAVVATTPASGTGKAVRNAATPSLRTPPPLRT